MMEDFFKLSILIVTRANKKDSLGDCPFGEGISLIMGCSKKYIMYWGFYVNYNIIQSPISVHKLYNKLQLFFVNYYQMFLCINTFPLFNCILTAKSLLIPNYKLSPYGLSSNKLSNSSLEIFSFSRRSSELL